MLDTIADARLEGSRSRFDRTAAGMAQIVELLTRRDDQ